VSLTACPPSRLAPAVRQERRYLLCAHPTGLADIVAARRERKWAHYKIALPKPTGAARILSETVSVPSEDKVMQSDLSRLTKACCAPQQLPALDGAPLPNSVEVVGCVAC
jgi:ArsR family transcriptional regulator, arsenate/arsenite/antimonite-responsive transcriptional repressor